MDTRTLTELAARWDGLRMGDPEHGAERAEILRRLVNTGNPWTAAYNAARFAGYLSGLSSANVFMRMLQSETERQEG